MRRRTPLFMAVDRNVISSGLQPDLHPVHKLLWELGDGAIFAAGKVKRNIPPADIITIVAPDFKPPIRGISQQQDTQGTRWLWGAVEDPAGNSYAVVRWFGPAYEYIGSLVGFQADETTKPATFIDFTHYGDWTWINSQNGQPWLLKPGISLAPPGDAPSGVATFGKFLNFMMAFGYGARGTRVGWSDADNIESWTASKTNLAGSLTVDDFDTRIKCAKRLGNSYAVYNEDQMALINYIGAPNVFGQRFALDGIGASGKFSVASDGKQHFGVGRGGVWWTDSLSYKYIDEGYLHDYLQDNVNWAQQSKITACRNDYTGCFEFSFPMRGAREPNEGWSFDPRTGGWSPVPAFALKDERRLFTKPIVGTLDGRLQRDNDAPQNASNLGLVTKPLLMQTGDDSMGFGSIHTSSRVDEVVLLFKDVHGVSFRLGSSQHVEGPWTWGPYLPCLPGSNTYDIGSKPADGVYYKLEFANALGAEWRLDLQGFMLFGSVEGTKRDVA